MLTSVNTITDVLIQKDASTKLEIFFAFAKMAGLANFAIKVSLEKSDEKFSGFEFSKNFST